MAYGKGKGKVKRKVAPKKGAYKKKPMRSLVPRDGTSLLCSSYFEIQNLQPGGGATNQKLSYSIKCDPKGLTLLASNACVANATTAGLFANKGDNLALIPAGQTNGLIPVARFTQFSGIYKQYRIQSIKVSVIVDRECGLENPISFTSSKGNNQPHDNMGGIVSGAHKSYTMTEARRTANYGWTAKTSEDREYRMASQGIAEGEAQFIKVFQEIEPKDQGLCRHRVNVSLNLVMKDSSNNYDPNALN